jgi:eukaryotic-like serine/threonine-protein kinase
MMAFAAVGRRVIIAALTVFCISSQAHCDDTAMFRGNARHTGVYDAAGVPALTGVKWTFHTRGEIISSPAVSHGTVYVGSTDGNLYAVDTANGALKWKFPTRVRITSSPAISGGRVYFGSYDGNFYALDAANGQPVWMFATQGEKRFAARHIHGTEPKAETMPDPFDFYLSSPAVSDGTVYFGSGDGNVYALDAATGNLKWKFQTQDVVHASPAVSDGLVLIGSWDSYFYALDAQSGALKWKFKTGVDPVIFNQVGIQSSAAVSEGTVFFGCRDSHFYALDVLKGKLKWSFDNKGSWVISSPAVRDGTVYFATSDSGLFYALDARTGSRRFSLNFNHWPMFSSPAIAGHMAYIGSHEGKLLAIDTNSGQLSWTFHTAGSVQNGPALTSPDGTPNYGAAFKGNFYDELISGVDRMMSIGAVLSSPTVDGRVIYVGSTDGNLYALN